MSSVLTKYSKLLEVAMVAAFPGMEQTFAECIPSSDLSFGDICSSLPTTIAAKLKLSAEEVGQRLISQLPAEFRARANNQAGYVNFKLQAAELIDIEQPNAIPQDQQKQLIILSGKPGEITEAGFFRLLCAALCQRELLRAQKVIVDVVFSDQVIFPSAAKLSTQDLLEFFTKWQQSSTATDQAALVELELSKHSLPATVWIHPDFLSKRGYRQFCANLESLAHQTNICCLDRAWYQLQPDCFDKATLKKIATYPYLSLIFYLSQNLVGNDTDISVPGLQESSNLWWYLQETVNRFSRWSKTFAHDQSGLQLDSIALQDELSLRRGKFLKTFMSRAARYGQVAVFLEVLLQNLREFNARFNHPDLRARLTTGHLKRIESGLFARFYEISRDMVTQLTELG